MYINSMYKSLKKSLKIKKIKKTKKPKYSYKLKKIKGKKPIFRLCCRTNKFRKY